VPKIISYMTQGNEDPSVLDAGNDQEEGNTKLLKRTVPTTLYLLRGNPVLPL